MDERTKELIAIGASIGAHCQPCLQYHVRAAADLGIAPEEIRQAIEVGQMVERGAMAAMRKFADSALNAGQAQGEGCCSGGKSGCCQ